MKRNVTSGAGISRLAAPSVENAKLQQGADRAPPPPEESNITVLHARSAPYSWFKVGCVELLMSVSSFSDYREASRFVDVVRS